VKLKLDENVHRDVAPALRALGHDVATVHDQGLAGGPDADLARDHVPPENLSYPKSGTGSAGPTIRVQSEGPAAEVCRPAGSRQPLSTRRIAMKKAWIVLAVLVVAAAVSSAWVPMTANEDPGGDLRLVLDTRDVHGQLPSRLKHVGNSGNCKPSPGTC
jgi:hypothetical protein